MPICCLCVMLILVVGGWNKMVDIINEWRTTVHKVIFPFWFSRMLFPISYYADLSLPFYFLVRNLKKNIPLHCTVSFMFYWWLCIKLNYITQRAMQLKRFTLLTFYCWRGQLAGCLNCAIDPKGQSCCCKRRKCSFQ